MVKLKRPEIRSEAARRNREQLARLGALARAARRRRRWTQASLAALVGLSRPTVSAIERGFGGSHTLDSWQRLAVALGVQLRVDLGRDPLTETADAGHLAIQELVLRLGRRAGYARGFEVATKPSDPSRSSDVGLRDDKRRILVLMECWNTIGDLGAAARSTDRKLAEVAELAIVAGGQRPFAVRGGWVVRATARNRALVARYPEVFAARFPGSSAAWVAALTRGKEPPPLPGLVWCDVGATRVFAWRRGRG
jgi:transcriptional regulator with XRE-family HTH domain